MKKNYIYLKLFLILNLFLLTSGCENLNGSTKKPSSPYKINVNLSNWKMTDMIVNNSGYFLLYEPISQGDVIKERIGIGYFKGQQYSLDKFFQDQVDGEKRFCESTSSEIISKDSNSISSFSKMKRCRTPSFHKKMFKVEKAFNQPDGFYTIRYVATDEVNYEEVIYMKQVIISSDLVKNVS